MPMASFTWIWLTRFELVLHRILDRHYVLLRGGEQIEDGVERRGLAAAGRAGHEDDAVRLGEDASER